MISGTVEYNTKKNILIQKRLQDVISLQTQMRLGKTMNGIPLINKVWITPIMCHIMGL